MTPDEVYLHHIKQALERIRAYTERGKGAFMLDPMAQDATIRNLEVIGEATKRLSETFRAEHPEIPWSRMAGMRDVLVHDYMGVDLEIVWDVIENRLGDLKTGLASLLPESEA